jgi:Cu-Zn family superoxide dismutase
MKKINHWLVGLAVVCSAGLAQASLVIPVHLTDANGVGQEIGTITADDSVYGLMLTPKLQGLPAGVHGFHIHEMPMCDHKGMDAAGHYDPRKTNAHRGPYADGHLGDLPTLTVDSDGKATTPVLAPRLKLADIKNRALMIHAGADNYSDTPEKLGGGGARLACGIIPYY